MSSTGNQRPVEVLLKRKVEVVREKFISELNESESAGTRAMELGNQHHQMYLQKALEHSKQVLRLKA